MHNAHVVSWLEAQLQPLYDQSITALVEDNDDLWYEVQEQVSELELKVAEELVQ